MKKKLLKGFLAAIVAIVLGVVVLRLAFPTTYDALRAFVMEQVFHKKDKGGVDASRVRVDGIDVSHHNGTIKWNEVAKNRKIKFVYVKATEGRSHKDTKFSQNVKGARKAGMEVGAYHFLKSSSAEAQFRFFQKTIQGKDLTLLPMVDIEEEGIGNMSPERLRAVLSEFCRLAKEKYGSYPILYTQAHIYRNVLAKDFSNYTIWISGYGYRPYTGNKGKVDIWQFTERGKVKGIKGYVDLDRFENGMTLEKLKLMK